MPLANPRLAAPPNMAWLVMPPNAPWVRITGRSAGTGAIVGEAGEVATFTIE